MPVSALAGAVALNSFPRRVNLSDIALRGVVLSD
jgi:hypothetical protein